jgi:hypothetical protein
MATVDNLDSLNGSWVPARIREAGRTMDQQFMCRQHTSPHSLPRPDDLAHRGCPVVLSCRAAPQDDNLQLRMNAIYAFSDMDIGAAPLSCLAGLPRKTTT